MLAGTAGYVLAIIAPTAIPVRPYPLPYALAIPLALIAATVAGIAVGLISVRTRDVTFLMLTLALAVGFSLFARSNIGLFNGYEGIRNVLGPDIFGVPVRTPAVLYYTALVTAALLYALVLHVVRTPLTGNVEFRNNGSQRLAANRSRNLALDDAGDRLCHHPHLSRGWHESHCGREEDDRINHCAEDRPCRDG